MKIELRWVVWCLCFEFVILTSFLGLRIYYSWEWMLSFIPLMISTTYNYAIEKTIDNER